MDVAGLLPIAATSQSGQPWPALAAASATSLASLKGAVNAKLNYGPIWTFPRAGLALNRAMVCTDTACSTKLADLELTAGATSAALNVNLGNHLAGRHDLQAAAHYRPHAGRPGAATGQPVLHGPDLRPALLKQGPLVHAPHRRGKG